MSEVSYWLRNDRSTHPGFQLKLRAGSSLFKIGNKKQIPHISGYEPEKDICSGKRSQALKKTYSSQTTKALHEFAHFILTN